MKRLLFLLLFLPACSAPPGHEHRIDLAARQIDGINFAGSLPQIRSQLGSNTIQVIPRDVVSDQGDRVIDTLLVISISGHQFIRYSDRTSVFVADSVFRTNEGVGVGSTIQEFVHHYGIPRFQEEDIGYTLIFKAFDLELLVYIDPTCTCEHDFATLDKRCIAVNFFITVPA